MLNLKEYKDKKEMVKDNPEIKSFSVALTIPRGMTNREAIRNLLLGRGIHEQVFIVGSFAWIKKVSIDEEAKNFIQSIHAEAEQRR